MLGFKGGAQLYHRTRDLKKLKIYRNGFFKPEASSARATHRQHAPHRTGPQLTGPVSISLSESKDEREKRQAQCDIEKEHMQTHLRLQEAEAESRQRVHREPRPRLQSELLSQVNTVGETYSLAHRKIVVRRKTNRSTCRTPERAFSSRKNAVKSPNAAAVQCSGAREPTDGEPEPEEAADAADAAAGEAPDADPAAWFDKTHAGGHNCAWKKAKAAASSNRRLVS